MINRRLLFKDSLIYALANSLDKGMPLLILPFLAAYLTQAQLGQVSLFQAAMMIFWTLTTFGLDGAIAIEKFKGNADRYANILNAALKIAFLVFTIFLIIVLIFSSQIEHFFELRNWMILCALGASIFWTVQIFLLSDLRVHARPKPYVMLQLGKTTLDLFLSILLVMVLQQQAEGRILALAAAPFLMGLISLSIFYKRGILTLGSTSAEMKPLLKFGVFLMPHLLSGLILAFVDRFILNEFLGADVVGVYFVAVTLGTLIQLPVQSFNQSWGPQVYKMLSAQDELSKKQLALFYIYLAVALIFAAGFFAFAGVMALKWFFNEHYAPAAAVIPLIAMGQTLSGFYALFSHLILYHRRTGVLSMVTGTSAVVILGCNFLFIPQYGMSGAAFAYVVSMVTSVLLVIFLGCRLSPLPWKEAFKSLQGQFGK